MIRRAVLKCSTAAGVAGVRVVAWLGGRRLALGVPQGVRRTRVPDQHCSLLDGVVTLLVARAWIDGVAVVEALADGVTLDQLDTHGGDVEGVQVTLWSDGGRSWYC